MNIELAREFAALLQEKRIAEELVRDTTAKMRRIELALITELLDNEIDSLPIKMEGGRKMTIYLHRQKWAKAKEGDREAVVAALKEEGLTEFLSENYNTSTLSAFVREADRDGEELPERLTETLDIDIVTSIRGRSSGASTSED